MLPEDHKTPFGTPPIPPVEQSAQLPPELSNPEGTPLQQPGEEIAPSGPVNDLGETAVEQLAPSPSQPVTPEDQPLQQPGQEVAPSGPVRDLGETAVEESQVVETGPPVDPETGQEIPPELTTEGSGNTVGPDHSINPETSEKRPPEEQPESREEHQTDTEDHEAITQQVAQSGTEERARAADIRRDVATEQAFHDKLLEIVNDPAFRDISLRHQLTVMLRGDALSRAGLPSRMKWEFDNYRDISDSAAGSLKEAYDVAMHSNSDIDKDDRQIHAFNPDWEATKTLNPIGTQEHNYEDPEYRLDQANRLDELADQKERWAKILLEHPVSEEYKTTHPWLDFSAEALIKLESVVDDRGGLYYHEHFMGDEMFTGPSPANVGAVYNAAHEARQTLLKEGDGEKASDVLEEFDKIAISREATTADLIDINIKLRQRHNELLKARIDERKQVLRDVKSGATSQPPEPTGVQEQQAA